MMGPRRELCPVPDEHVRVVSREAGAREPPTRLQLLPGSPPNEPSEGPHADPVEPRPPRQRGIELRRDEVGLQVLREGEGDAFPASDGLEVVVEDGDLHRRSPGAAASTSPRIFPTNTDASNRCAFARHRPARDSRSAVVREGLQSTHAWGVRGRRNPVPPSICVSRYPPPSAATITFPDASASAAVIPKSSSTDVETTPRHVAYRRASSGSGTVSRNSTFAGGSRSRMNASRSVARGAPPTTRSRSLGRRRNTSVASGSPFSWESRLTSSQRSPTDSNRYRSVGTGGFTTVLSPPQSRRPRPCTFRLFATIRSIEGSARSFHHRWARLHARAKGRSARGRLASHDSRRS